MEHCDNFSPLAENYPYENYQLCTPVHYLLSIFKFAVCYNNSFKFHCSLFKIREEQFSKFSFLLTLNNLVLIYIHKIILHILEVKQLKVQENIAFKIPVLNRVVEL